MQRIDKRLRRLFIAAIVAWLSGCAQSVIPMPIQVKPNSYVVYYVVDMNAAACWVDHYDDSGKLVQHDLCTATPVLGGFAPTMTGAVAIGTAIGAIAK